MAYLKKTHSQKTQDADTGRVDTRWGKQKQVEASGYPCALLAVGLDGADSALVSLGHISRPPEGEV